MLQQVADFFNRFYLSILREHINDPIIHSQWNYFLSMFKTANLEKERIELYLSILNSQKNKHKDNNKNIIGSYTEVFKSKPQSKIQLVNSHQNQYQAHDLKLDKRYSQNWKINHQSKTSKDIIKLTPQPFSMKKKTSEEQTNKNNKSIQNESKTIRIKSDSYYTTTTPFTPHAYSYLRPQSPTLKATQTKQNKLKERHKKLCQISDRLVNAFEGVKLRA